MALAPARLVKLLNELHFLSAHPCESGLESYVLTDGCFVVDEKFREAVENTDPEIGNLSRKQALLLMIDAIILEKNEERKDDSEASESE